MRKIKRVYGKIKANKARILIVIGACFLAFGVPVIINECYKQNSGYITLWGPEDVLSYYGTILGAAVSVAVMAVTILFTRKQIQRESYLKNESEKWTRIENVFSDILADITPMQVLIKTMDDGFTDPAKVINICYKYQIVCRTACNRLNSYLNSVDYPKVKSLIDRVYADTDNFFTIAQDEIDAYSKLRNLRNRGTAFEVIAKEAQCPNSFSKEEIASYKKLIQDTEELTSRDIEARIFKINTRMVDAYQETYRSLLQCKGATFDVIHAEVQRNADCILHLWRKR